MKDSCNFVKENPIVSIILLMCVIVIAICSYFIVVDSRKYDIHGIRELRVENVIDKSKSSTCDCSGVDVILYDRSGNEYKVEYNSRYEDNIKKLIFSREVYDIAITKLQNKDDSYVKIDFDNLKILDE